MNLKKIISQGESETVEFKKSLSEGKEIIKAVSAFANTKEGGNRPYRRVGKSTLRMPKDEYKRIILEKHKDKIQFDTQINLEVTIKDINKDKLRWFPRKAKEEKNYDINPETPPRETLNRLNLIKDRNLTNTAILLCGKDPQKFFPQVKIKAGRFKGVEGLDFINMKILEGTILELQEKAMKFVMTHVKHSIFFDPTEDTIDGSIL